MKKISAKEAYETVDKELFQEMNHALVLEDEGDGVRIINGNSYNKYGVCLDCNGWNMNCLHQNLTEEGGVAKCVMCGQTF